MDQSDQREPRLLKEDAGQERERGMGEVEEEQGQRRSPQE